MKPLFISFYFSKPVDFVYILPCAGLRVKFIAKDVSVPINKKTVIAHVQGLSFRGWRTFEGNKYRQNSRLKATVLLLRVAGELNGQSAYAIVEMSVSWKDMLMEMISGRYSWCDNLVVQPGSVRHYSIIPYYAVMQMYVCANVCVANTTPA